MPTARKPLPRTGNQPMTAAQATTLKRLTQDAYERDAFKPNLTRFEADTRIAMLTAKLKLLDAVARQRLSACRWRLLL